MATADPGVGSWTPINMWAMLRALINNGCPILTFNGAPTNGTSGTYAGQAGKGAILIDFATPAIYQNTGTLASPTWTVNSPTVLTATASEPAAKGSAPAPERAHSFESVAKDHEIHDSKDHPLKHK